VKRRSSQRGATLVEAAVTTLLLFTILFGILEFGRAFNIYQTITNAAREGARFSVAPFPGVSTLPDNASVTSHVQDFLTAASITGADVSVNQSQAGPTVNGIASVSTEVDVSAPYQFLFFPFGSITMTSRAVMRNEND
jgi:Flp pilus assembly protein TadG